MNIFNTPESKDKCQLRSYQINVLYLDLVIFYKSIVETFIIKLRLFFIIYSY